MLNIDNNCVLLSLKQKLFNLYLNMKMNDSVLRMEELSVKYTLYADDQVILKSSSEDLQNMVT